MDSIHEFLMEKYDRLNGGEATPEEIRDMVNELLEMAKRDERDFKGHYVVLVKHMLKYIYQKNRQGSYWIKSIRNSHSYLADLVEDASLVKKVLPLLDMFYQKARREASGETRLSIQVFPEKCPIEWSLKNLTDYAFIDNFLVDNVSTEEAKKYLCL